MHYFAINLINEHRHDPGHQGSRNGFKQCPPVESRNHDWRGIGRNTLSSCLGCKGHSVNQLAGHMGECDAHDACGGGQRTPGQQRVRAHWLAAGPGTGDGVNEE
jgi:hypothetical protein